MFWCSINFGLELRKSNRLLRSTMASFVSPFCPTMHLQFAHCPRRKCPSFSPLPSSLPCAYPRASPKTYAISAHAPPFPAQTKKNAKFKANDWFGLTNSAPVHRVAAQANIGPERLQRPRQLVPHQSRKCQQVHGKELKSGLQ